MDKANVKINADKSAKTEAMGKEKIPKLVMSFALTTLAALVLNTVYNLTDTFFVSWGIGDNAMGGVSVVFPFVILQGAVSTAVGGGAASLVSRKIGEGKNAEAGEITLNAMLVFYITAALSTAVCFIFLDPLLKIMGATEELYPYAKEYFVIILAGNVFSTGFSSIIRAEGKMLYGLLIWVIPMSVNIILDAVFILVLKWGVAGSAAATVFCQFASFAMCVVFFKKFTVQSFSGAKLKFGHVAEIIRTGLPSLVQMSSLSVMYIFMNNALKDAGGTLGINAFAYMSRLITYSAVPFTAAAQALAPIVGYNYGAGNKERVKKTVDFCIFISFVYAVAALIVCEAVPQYLLRIFTADADIINAGANGMRIVSAALPFIPLPLLAGAAMQAMGKKIWPLLFYAANLVFLIPLSVLMAKHMGINGIWWAFAVSAACATVFASVKMIFVLRKYKTVEIQRDKSPL
jgi:putative MATE family efflux protein